VSNSMFERLGNSKPSQQQSPKTAVMNRMKELGIQVPQGMEDNPNALLQHVMQSGAVPQNRLTMAQKMIQNMFGRR